MLVVCAWCGRLIDWRPCHYGQTSHGICKPCRDKLLVEYKDNFERKEVRHNVLTNTRKPRDKRR